MGIGHKFPRAVALGTRDPGSRLAETARNAPPFDSHRIVKQFTMLLRLKILKTPRAGCF
jgi:hypothetical protein